MSPESYQNFEDLSTASHAKQRCKTLSRRNAEKDQVTGGQGCVQNHGRKQHETVLLENNESYV